MKNAPIDKKLLRIYLNRISYNYPEIPKIPYFDEKMLRNAVSAFQEIFGFRPTGYADETTVRKIISIYKSISRIASLAGKRGFFGAVSVQYPGELRRGREGDMVRLLQRQLAVLGAFYPISEIPEITGVFNDETEKALKELQHAFELPETGITDRTTWNNIFRAYLGILDFLGSEKIPSVVQYSGTELREGISDTNVRVLQEYINHISEALPDIPDVKDTGYFGSVTRRAVEALQKLLGLETDGLVDEKTWDAISGLYLDLLIGEEKRPFQFPGYILSADESEGVPDAAVRLTEQ